MWIKDDKWRGREIKYLLLEYYNVAKSFIVFILIWNTSPSESLALLAFYLRFKDEGSMYFTAATHATLILFRKDWGLIIWTLNLTILQKHVENIMEDSQDAYQALVQDPVSVSRTTDETIVHGLTGYHLPGPKGVGHYDALPHQLLWQPSQQNPRVWLGVWSCHGDC